MQPSVIKKPLIGLTLMIEPAFFEAAHPLFAAGEVGVVEWTFDVGWGAIAPPVWAENLLDFYSSQKRLLGHGVSYSPLSAAFSERQQRWLQCLKMECERRSYRYVSEHFGWMAAGKFHQGAPLPLPRTKETVEIGVENLKRIAEASNLPVGLENLAFAFGKSDVAEQGLFLEELLAPVDGFLILDLHNLYCQAFNFQIPAEELLETYPLARVRELHVSGGSWSSFENNGKTEQIRRDTHDDKVPPEVFDLLAVAIKKCPNLETIIFEQIGSTLNAAPAAQQFRDDFRKIKQITSATIGCY